MNKLFVGDEAEPVLDEDALPFYERISRITGQSLDATRDSLIIKAAPWSSRNSSAYARICDHDSGRRVCLKRCSDSADFLRREQLIPKVKVALGLPSYSLDSVQGIVLRNPSSGKNCTLLLGWENKTTLLVDYGNPGVSESMATLQLGSITDLPKFCRSYGRWCAFDYLLGVRDRNPGNFVYFKDTGELHSVDNEEGPFNTDGRFAGVEDILIQTKQNIDRFVNGINRIELVRELRFGFVEVWNLVREKVSSLSMLSEKELELLKTLVQGDPARISENYA